jgi:hypothetical protein
VPPASIQHFIPFQLSSQGDHGRVRRCRQVRSHPPVHVRRVRRGLRAHKGRLISEKGPSSSQTFGHKILTQKLTVKICHPISNFEFML